MTTEHAGDDHPRRAICEIVALLDSAYEQTCAGSQFTPMRVDLGLGILLVRAQACHGLVPGWPVPESERSDQIGVPALLRTAEHLTRELPPAKGALPDVSDLVEALGDLIRDADRVAW